MTAKKQNTAKAETLDFFLLRTKYATLRLDNEYFTLTDGVMTIPEKYRTEAEKYGEIIEIKANVSEENPETTEK